MMRRLPPRPPPRFLNDPHQRHLRKVLLDREDVEVDKSNMKVYAQYSLVQVGTSPLDLLYDVSKGIDAVSQTICDTLQTYKFGNHRENHSHSCFGSGLRRQGAWTFHKHFLGHHWKLSGKYGLLTLNCGV